MTDKHSLSENKATPDTPNLHDDKQSHVSPERTVKEGKTDIPTSTSGSATPDVNMPQADNESLASEASTSSDHKAAGESNKTHGTHDYLHSPVKKETPLVWVQRESSTDYTPPTSPRKSAQDVENGDGQSDENGTPPEPQNQDTHAGMKAESTAHSASELSHPSTTSASAAGPSPSIESGEKTTNTDDTETPLTASDGGDNGGDGGNGGNIPPSSPSSGEEDNDDGSGDGSGDGSDDSSGDSNTDDSAEEGSDDSSDGDSDCEDPDDDDEEEEEEEGPTTLREHLLDLRKRVFYMFLWTVAGFALCFPFATEIFNQLMGPMLEAMSESMAKVVAAQSTDAISLFMTPMMEATVRAVQSNSPTEVADIYHFLIQPMLETILRTAGDVGASNASATLIYTAPSEAFFTEMKVAFVAGLFVMSPMIFYQVWRFIAPGLYSEEKRMLLPLAFASGFFFVAGGSFCYLVAFPTMFKFFMGYTSASITAMPSLKESLSFSLQVMVAFGVVFEMPLFTFFLARLGLVTGKMLRSFWRYSLIIILIVTAVLTPPDLISQLLMAVPMLLLYGVSIGIAEIFGRKSLPEKGENDDKESEEEEEEEEEDPNK